MRLQTLKQSIVDSTIAFGRQLSLTEVGIRALAEVAIIFTLVVVVRFIFEKLADRFGKVCPLLEVS